ncbi:beta-glucosidase [Xylogone sp. PMI_703]|nr:beta-glucosidase [Xylogone sp. PMI_703]
MHHSIPLDMAINILLSLGLMLESATAWSGGHDSFTYTAETTTRYATPIRGPLPSKTFAPHFKQLSTLLPSRLVYTTYSLDPTATADGQYGQSAYAALWKSLTYSNTVLPFTTTVSPTPVPTSSLLFPPAQYEPCPHSFSCLSTYSLPEDFVWGVASSAWQVEGATMSEGRGPGYVDQIGALPQPAENPMNDSVISDMHYFLYKQDIARLAAIGIPYYSFSISWPRIVPFGIPGSPINQLGLDHYDDVIETCLSYGITPIVTLTHGDVPLVFGSPLVLGGVSDLGYSNEKFVDAFLYYAKIVLTRYADRVPYWVTINEPNVSFGPYRAHRNILLAHAKASRFYKEEIGGKGKVTIKFAYFAGVPLDVKNHSHVEAALRYQDFTLGIEANPIFLGQDYPETVKSTANISLANLSKEDLQYIHGTADFLSVDAYQAVFAYPPPNGIQACAANSSDPNWPVCVLTTNVGEGDRLNGDASNSYAYMTPQYFRQALKYPWQTFRPPAIAITEFGFNPFMDSAKPFESQRYDYERSEYFDGFLREMLKAKYEDGINIIGAIAWSILDNNEFGSYAQQYGMQYVNKSSPTLERTYKRSMFDFVDFFHRVIRK